MKKSTRLILSAILISIAAGGTAFGYWVDKAQADCNIPLKRNVKLLITGLETEESKPPEEGNTDEKPSEAELDFTEDRAIDE